MKNVEFYFLLDDYTWNTDFIDIPDDIVGDMTVENEKAAIDYVYNKEKLHEDVVIVGLYSWGENKE